MGEDESFERDAVDVSVANPLHQCLRCVVGPEDEPRRDFVIDRDQATAGEEADHFDAVVGPVLFRDLARASRRSIDQIRIGVCLDIELQR